MKNLKLLELTKHKFTDELQNVQFVTQINNDIYYYSNALYKTSFGSEEVTEIWPESLSNVLQIEFLPIERKICIATPTSLHIIDQDDEMPPIEAVFVEPIKAISWNPTAEIVIVITESNNVQSLLINYETGDFIDHGQSTIDASIPDTVYVGWGSKDTQFRGSEGKLRPDQTPKTFKPIFDQKPTISWRGNGEMFVINYWTDQQRKFIVFEAPCKAAYRSDDFGGLQTPIAWRPTGNMIATLAENNDVVIFEKNGQKRFIIELNLEQFDKVEELKWSPCSQILALKTKSSILLIKSSNYKWYKKQELNFTHSLLNFDWLETNDSTFILQAVTSNYSIKYTFGTVVEASENKIGVVDGHQLKITDFKEVVIPPILSGQQLVVEKGNIINFVCFNKQHLITIDSQQVLTHFDWSFKQIDQISLGETIKHLFIPLAFHHFVLEDDLLYFITENDTPKLYLYDLNKMELKEVSESLKSLRFFTPKNWNLVSKENTLQHFYETIDNINYHFELLSNYQLLLNNELISEGVNSFLVHDSKFLLFTTKHNQLFTAFLNQVKDRQFYKRAIEQGGILIAAIGNSAKLVLQMPRGNLETISSRLISIDLLDQLLACNKWKEAVDFIRIEKLNANLLFDLNPTRFLNQMNTFINAMTTQNDLISVFLELEEKNVLETLYKNCNTKEETFDRNNKISAIFKQVLTYFNTCSDYAPYINVIVVINWHFFTLKAALQYVQDLHCRSLNNKDLQVKVIDAIKMLKNYGCDDERLYFESLLTYNLQFAQFIAGTCQLDPRIYEPQINDLKNEKDEARRRYQCNIVAQSPQAAIRYLLRCENVTIEEIGTFLRANPLSGEAYKSCPKESPLFGFISEHFAKELAIKGAHAEAGVVLKRAKLYEKALIEFRKAGVEKWRDIVELVDELNVVDRENILTQLGYDLLYSGCRAEALIVYEELKQIIFAIKVLNSNCFYFDAIHLAKKHNLNYIIVLEVIPKVLDDKVFLTRNLQQLFALFEQQKSRLIAIRKAKAIRFENHHENDYNDDVYSDGGSTVSGFSRLSNRSRSTSASSRIRRKEARKKQDLREGGVYEDIALIRALHGLIKELYRKQIQVKEVCLVLLQESELGFAGVKELYDSYQRFDEGVKKSIAVIWPAHFYYNGNNALEVEQLADLDNFQHLDLEYRTPPFRPFEFKLNMFN